MQVPVHPADDHQVSRRDDEGRLTTRAQGEEGSGGQPQPGAGARGIGGRRGPPQITVTPAVCGVSVRPCALPHPVRRYHLPSSPYSAAKIQQREPGEVTRAHADRIRTVDRGGAGEIFTVLRPIVLHFDRPRDLLLQRIINSHARGMLVNRAERVKIPVIIVPERTGGMTTARRARRRHCFCFIQRGMINPRARLQQHSHGRLFLDIGQRRRIIVDPQMRQRVVQVDLLPRHRDPNQRAEQTLAHGGELRAFDRAPPSTTTTPCATTISAVEWSAFARSCATVSAASDQPASEAGEWCHSAPGNTLSAFAQACQQHEQAGDQNVFNARIHCPAPLHRRGWYHTRRKGTIGAVAGS